MTMVLEIDQFSHLLLPSGVLVYQQERVSRRCNFQSNANNDKYLRHYLPVDNVSRCGILVEHIPSFWPVIPDYFPQYDSTSAAISTIGSIINVRRTSRRGRIGHLLQSIHVQRVVNGTPPRARACIRQCQFSTGGTA